MADRPKHVDPFKPQDPTIPGVTGNPARVRPAPMPPAPLGPRLLGSALQEIFFADSRVVAGIAIAIVLLVGFGLFWRSHSTSAKETKQVEAPLAPAMASPASPAVEPAIAKQAAIGPGPVATAAELAKPWSSKRFVFRAPPDR